MRLVVDTNILVSFFRPNPVNEIISKSKSISLSLLSPEYAINGLKSNSKNLLKYSGLTLKELNKKLSDLQSIIEVVPNKLFKDFKSEAEKLIHDKDVPFFALALKLDCPIWSNEHAFKRQSKVEILSTREMIELFDSFFQVE